MHKNIPLVVGITILFLGLAVAPLTQGIVSESIFNEIVCDIGVDINKILRLFVGNNSPPYAPSNYTPCGGPPVDIDVNLSWDGGDPDPEDTATYDVYFGSYLSPPKVATVGPYPWNQTRIEYDPGTLEFSTNYYWYIVAWDDYGHSTKGSICSFTTRGNSPPYTPTPIPRDGSICGFLEWYGGDPDSEDNVTYNVYFGEHDPLNPPPFIAIVGSYPANWTYICYDLEENLEFSTRYDLCIVAFDNHGANNSSGIWSFITEDNEPPNPTKDPIPHNNSKNVAVNATLYWNGTDPNSCDELVYDVYFGKNTNPPKVRTGQTEYWYDPYGEGDMDLYQVYFWRIVTRDREGLETSGPEWTFSTGVNCTHYEIDIDGPILGRPRIIYYYNFSIDDYEGYDLLLWIDWGDGTYQTERFESGQNVTVGHSWEKKGTYIIHARAMNEFGAIIAWGDLKIVIPRNKAINSLFTRLIEQYPLLEVLLRIMNLLR